MNTPLGVYISVPFCKAKCTFCNFASGAFAPERLQGYVNRLEDEIRGSQRSAARLGAPLVRTVDTVYFGGGTPSLLSSAQVAQIFRALRAEFEVETKAEITLECAPGQLADETLEELLRHGTNRVSLGVQSFVDRETAAVGRLHTSDTCEEEIRRLRAAGVEDINVDLIAGLPYQTEESWRYSVERTIESGAPHVSVYMLEVDEDSRLGKEVLTHGARYHARDVPDEDATSAYYEMACEMLDPAGIRQYEISNFAREGHRSRHNLKYWKRQPYIGFGLDAHSMLPTPKGAVRFANTDDLDTYLAGESVNSPFTLLPPADLVSDTEPRYLCDPEAFEESLFLGLRLNEGVQLDLLRTDFGGFVVEEVMPSVLELCGAGLLTMDRETIRLTMRGRMISNEVFSRLLVPVAA
jgi:oxygen-independent coproporphyrinogen III oxidase